MAFLGQLDRLGEKPAKVGHEPGQRAEVGFGSDVPGVEIELNLLHPKEVAVQYGPPGGQLEEVRGRAVEQHLFGSPGQGGLDAVPREPGASLSGKREEPASVIKVRARNDAVTQRAVGMERLPAVLPARSVVPCEVHAGLRLAYATEAATAPSAVDTAPAMQRRAR